MMVMMLIDAPYSSSFWMAVLARFLWGLLNGNLGVAKCYVSEVCVLSSVCLLTPRQICDDTNSASGFSFLGAFLHRHVLV
jgi:hypothetical protein